MEFFLWIIIDAAVLCAVFWFFNRRRTERQGVATRRAMREEGGKELRELFLMRARSLNLPLSEKARPVSLKEIVGQEDGIRALKAAMCGPNPQHVIIYGPPGCGKTCAARLVLEEAKKRSDSPFDAQSRFVEVDATCVRFDERAIADPLLGSVHDPIYQGAGALGAQGVPQPKPGAVSRAHCGVLFLDEIGELHPLQMNKLLKVLEDRRVFFDSAYYSRDNTAIPPHIHDIFQNGMPADFRLIGATTRSPEELPPALRSRCVELYFRPLTQKELEQIVRGAADRIGYAMGDEAVALCAQFCASGRDAVNMVQLGSGAAYDEGRREIAVRDIEWVAEVSRCVRRVSMKIPERTRAGVSIGLGVGNAGQGAIIEIECTAEPAEKGKGTLDLGGLVETEEIELNRRRLKRKSTALASVENVLRVFQKRFLVDCRDYDIRFNIPGGMPMDGPSAGIALAVALMSALTGKPALALLALTGEITVQGEVRPVGGVREKLEAAALAGAKTVLLPAENYEPRSMKFDLEIVPVSDIAEVMRVAFSIPREAEGTENVLPLIVSA
ncbi:MAG: ATP-dependent protease LonB [Clostridiaceae bacterium]